MSLENLNVIWIDENIDSKENLQYQEELQYLKISNIKFFKNINDAIKNIRNLHFEEIKIILSGRLYSKFVLVFKEILTQIFVYPKIIVFTGNKEKFIEYNKAYLNKDNNIFDFCGIFTSFKEIKNFLIKDSPKEIQTLEDKIPSTFEYLDNNNKMLPLYYKALIDLSPIEDIQKYTKYLYDTYSIGNERVKQLLEPIKEATNIPIEILSKYYVRLNTIESDFYKDIDNDLKLSKFAKHLPYIKTLYEGVRLKSLPLSNDYILYGGCKISIDEINKLINYSKNKIPVILSKPFLSFHKDKNIAEKFIQFHINESTKETKVLFILEKNDNLEYNLMTHCDSEKISMYPGEKEVLFFPFSFFEIKCIKEKSYNYEKIYEINLLYLGNYLKNDENNKNSIFNESNKISETEFKIHSINFSLLKSEFNEINENRPSEKAISEKNVIISEVNINTQDINKDIQIINSYENYRRKKETKDGKINPEYDNEKDIKENIEIKINGKKIPFAYTYKFKKEGKYRIEYIFKKNITKINHIFSGCWRLTHLDFSCFDTQNVINMSHLFYDCFSLISLDLSNFNTLNADKVFNMFNGCKSLKDINLSNAHIQNVNEKTCMFYDCNSLKKKILSLSTLKFD